MNKFIIGFIIVFIIIIIILISSTFSTKPSSGTCTEDQPCEGWSQDNGTAINKCNGSTYQLDMNCTTTPNVGYSADSVSKKFAKLFTPADGSTVVPAGGCKRPSDCPETQFCNTDHTCWRNPPQGWVSENTTQDDNHNPICKPGWGSTDYNHPFCDICTPNAHGDNCDDVWDTYNIYTWDTYWWSDNNSTSAYKNSINDINIQEVLKRGLGPKGEKPAATPTKDSCADEACNSGRRMYTVTGWFPLTFNPADASNCDKSTSVYGTGRRIRGPDSQISTSNQRKAGSYSCN